jgi:signal transduction histidine kinase
LFVPGLIESDRMAQYLLQEQSNSQKPVMADASSVENPGVSPLDEAVHELRQPLSVIESLAYYLELTSEDESACAHLRQIQAMVERVHCILAQVPSLARQSSTAW